MTSGLVGCIQFFQIADKVYSLNYPDSNDILGGAEIGPLCSQPLNPCRYVGKMLVGKEYVGSVCGSLILVVNMARDVGCMRERLRDYGCKMCMVARVEK